jgi:hypothetical protein
MFHYAEIIRDMLSIIARFLTKEPIIARENEKISRMLSGLSAECQSRVACFARKTAKKQTQTTIARLLPGVLTCRK